MRSSRRARLGLILLGAVALALLAVALVLPRLFPIDRYQPMIAARVKEATGRAVSLGTISLRLLPGPALVAGPVTVSEGARYPGRDALRAESVSIRLGLFDLLFGRIAIRSIVLNHPVLTLIRDARGRWSYDDLLAKASAVSGAPAATARPAAGLEVLVTEARVRAGILRVYDDAVAPGSRAEAILDPVDATVRGWGSGAPTDIDLSVGMGKSVIRVGARLRMADGAGRMDLKVPASTVRAPDLVPLLPWLGVASPKGLEVAGRIDLEGAGTLPLDKPENIRLEGTLRLTGLGYRDASMSHALSGLGGTLRISGDRAIWNDFTASFGASTLTGKAEVTDFRKPRVNIALSGRRVDCNEIVAALTPAGSGGSARGTGTDRGGASEPGGLLDLVSGTGTIDLGSVRFLNFDLSGVHAGLRLGKRTLALTTMQAGLYGGKLEGTATVDLETPEPRYVLGVGLKGIDVDPLLTAYDPGLKKLLRGTLTGRLDVEAGGSELSALTRTARGSANLEVSQGAITSISVLGQLAALLEMAGGKGIGRQETPFDYLRGSLRVGDGKAHTDDLALHASDLDLAGAGFMGLDGTLDLAITARLSAASTRAMMEKTPRLGSLADKEGRLVAHLRVTGDLAKPAIGLDARAQVREVQDKAKDKVQQHLKDRLRDLLGRPGDEKK